MKNLKKREKYLLIILAVTVVAYVYAKYFLMPVLDNISINRQNIEKFNGQINILKILHINNNKSTEKLDKVKIDYAKALTKLPALELNPQIAYNLKPLADKSNVVLENISLSDGVSYIPKIDTTQKANIPQDVSNLYSVTVNLNVTADSYTNMMDFVNALETDNRIARITNFSLQSQKTESIERVSENTTEDISEMNQGDTTTTLQSITAPTTQTEDINITDIQPEVTTTTEAAIQIEATNFIVETTSVNASITINYFYYSNGTNIKPNYDFNKGFYGKDDPLN